MTNLLSAFVWGNSNFGLDLEGYHPALYVFGFPIYLYAICIVTGMCLAILIGGLYLKKRGYDPYDITMYALAIIPLGVMGARAYVYIFPWDNVTTPDWSTYFDFRSGGLGIYGGVIVGYIAAFVTSKIKKQDFRIITDSIMPGVLLAQSLGRWGNFFNQEAYGNLITTNYDALAHGASGLFARFNGYAVWIDATHGGQAGWYQATFFYESVCTFLGFLLCVLVLTRSKRYKLGWCTAFYGIYYGIARLIIEGMRSDSLYLYVGKVQTDIKISQLVSVVTIVLGLWTLSNVYRKQLHGLYKRFFKDDYQEMLASRWVLLGLAVVALGVAVTMYALGGESKFIIGTACLLLSVYSGLGVWSLFDRLKLYCPNCRQISVDSKNWSTPYQRNKVATVVYLVLIGALTAFGLFSLIKWGIMDGIPNGVVLAVLCLLCIVVIAIWMLRPALDGLRNSQKQTADCTYVCCDQQRAVQLNQFLLFVFPPKKYINYGVEHLKPWVDPQKTAKKEKKNA